MNHKTIGKYVYRDDNDTHHSSTDCLWLRRGHYDLGHETSSQRKYYMAELERKDTQINRLFNLLENKKMKKLLYCMAVVMTALVLWAICIGIMAEFMTDPGAFQMLVTCGIVFGGAKASMPIWRKIILKDVE